MVKITNTWQKDRKGANAVGKKSFDRLAPCRVATNQFVKKEQKHHSIFKVQ